MRLLKLAIQIVACEIWCSNVMHVRAIVVWSYGMVAFVEEGH